jgi:hypothetical protein
MSAALYLATAIALLWAANRWICPIPRWAAAVVILLPCCFTGRALLIDGLYGPFDLPYEVIPLVSQRAEHGFGTAYNGMISDLYTQIIPYRKAVHDALSRGEWPLWNPYTLSGEPLAAEAQPAAYSPFTLIALLLPVAKSFTFTGSIWFFIAALSAYVFLRELGGSNLASLLAAAGFMSSAALVFFILWPLGQCFALLPFVFLSVRRLDRTPWPLLIALTLVILAGHPESVLHVVFLGAAYGLFHLTKRALLHAIAAGVLSLGVCAIYLLPFMEASKQTEDFTSRSRQYAFQKRSVPVRDQLFILATNVLPDAQQRLWRSYHGYLVRPYSAVVGSIVLTLALYAMWRVRGREKWFFTGMLVFCLLEHIRSPIEDVMQRLPLFDIAINDRFAFGAAFAFVVLAAMGIDDLNRNGLRPVPAFALIGLGVLIVIIVLTRVITPMMWPSREHWGTYREFADVFFLGVALLFVILRPRIAVPALLVCVVAQRTMQEGGVIPTFASHVAYPYNPVFDPTLRVREPFRIVGQGMSFLPGTNAFYGLEDVRGYSPMLFRRYAATYDLWCRREPVFVNVVDELHKPFLNMMNVRFALTVAFVPPPAGWREVARYRAAKLLENENYIPRAFVPNFVHVGSRAPLMEMSLAEDFRNHSWIDLPSEPDTQRVNGPGKVAIRRARYGFDFDVDMEHGGWVVISESAWPGWRTYVDGRRIRFQYANIAFLGVYVPAGKHAVKAVYWPESFVNGRAISFATLAAIAIFILVRRRSATRGTDPRPSRS